MPAKKAKKTKKAKEKDFGPSHDEVVNPLHEGEKKEANEVRNTFNSKQFTIRNALDYNPDGPLKIDDARAFLANEVLHARNVLQPDGYSFKNEKDPGNFKQNIFSRLTQRRDSDPYLLTAAGTLPMSKRGMGLSKIVQKEKGNRVNSPIHPDMWTEAMFQNAVGRNHPEFGLKEFDESTDRNIPVEGIMQPLLDNRRLLNEHTTGNPYRTFFYSEIAPCDEKSGVGCDYNLAQLLNKGDMGWYSTPHSGGGKGVKLSDILRDQYGQLLPAMGEWDANKPVQSSAYPRIAEIVDSTPQEIHQKRLAAIERQKDAKRRKLLGNPVDAAGLNAQPPQPQIPPPKQEQQLIKRGGVVKQKTNKNIKSRQMSNREKLESMLR